MVCQNQHKCFWAEHDTHEEVRILAPLSCLYDPEHGFLGYESHSYSNGNAKVDDYDERNSVKSCDLCNGSGNHDPLPQILELTDERAAEAWIIEELPRSSGPCDLWTDFPETGWYATKNPQDNDKWCSMLINNDQ